MVGFRYGLWLPCVVALSACSSGSDYVPPVPDGSDNAAPALLGTPPTFVWQGEPYAFAPAASDADGDRLVFEIENQPSWTRFDPGTGRLTGRPALADVGTHPGVRIGVNDGSASVWLPAFEIVVDPVSHGSVTLSWAPPTENTDATPLNDLTGFRIYWGTDREALGNAVTVDGAATAEYLFSDLPGGTYYFATTAVNSFGVESEVSELAAILVH